MPKNRFNFFQGKRSSSSSSSSSSNARTTGTSTGELVPTVFKGREFKMNEFLPLREKGEVGNYKIVRECGLIDTCVLKEVKSDFVSNDNQFKLLRRDLWNRRRHPNIVSYLGHTKDPTATASNKKMIIVNEYLPVGSLKKFLHNRPPETLPLNFNNRVKIALGVCNALYFLSCSTFLDIKYFRSSNVLLTADFDPKIDDYDLRRYARIKNDSSSSSSSTTVLEQHGQSIGSIEAYGLFLVELFSGQDPTTRGFYIKTWAETRLGDMELFMDKELKGERELIDAPFKRIMELIRTCLDSITATFMATKGELENIMGSL